MSNEKSTQLEATKKKELTPSQRFVGVVMREFGQGTGEANITLSDYQRRLVQGYFIMVDRALTIAEENRLKKNASNTNHNYDNNTPYIWQNVNMRDLALDAVHYARMGLDMQEKNHLFPIPYLNKKTGLYDISFTVGYNGIRYIAEKYAVDPPKSVTIELVYDTDVFKPIKKSRSNSVETYDFEITNPFNRGNIIGGFGYIEYADSSKNELVMMSAADFKKRAGKNANAEFWGTKFSGKQGTVWENGKKTYADTDGWADEMCRKTIIREVFSGKHIPRDPAKFDDGYQHLQEREVVYAQAEIDSEAEQMTGTKGIDIPTQEKPLEIQQDTVKTTEIPSTNNNQNAVGNTNNTKDNSEGNGEDEDELFDAFAAVLPFEAPDF